MLKFIIYFIVLSFVLWLFSAFFLKSVPLWLILFPSFIKTIIRVRLLILFRWLPDDLFARIVPHLLIPLFLQTFLLQILLYRFIGDRWNRVLCKIIGEIKIYMGYVLAWGRGGRGNRNLGLMYKPRLLSNYCCLSLLRLIFFFMLRALRILSFKLRLNILAWSTNRICASDLLCLRLLRVQSSLHFKFVLNWCLLILFTVLLFL
jgi:hypothetical protein